MTTLVVKHTNHTYTAWSLTTPDGSPECLAEQRPFNELIDKLPDTGPRLLLWPGQLMTATHVKLPKTSASARLQAIPFALEEQLATPVEQLFFAILQAEDAEGRTHVAVINRELFSTECQQWQTADLPLDAIVPDFLALPTPTEATTWTMMIGEEGAESVARVRTGEYSGFTIERPQLEEWIKLYCDETQHHPQRIDCIVPNDRIPLPDLSDLDITVKPTVTAPWFETKVLLPQPPINLMQGEFRAKHRASRSQRHWRRCWISLASLIVIAVVGKAANLIYLNTQVDHLKQKVRAIYTQIFPSATDVIEPRFRINTRIAELKKAQAGDPFIQLLAHVADGLAASPQLHLTDLSYTDNILTLTVQANNSNQVQTFTQALLNLGLTAKQTQLTPGRGTVTAQLTLSEPGHAR